MYAIVWTSELFCTIGWVLLNIAVDTIKIHPWHGLESIPCKEHDAAACNKNLYQYPNDIHVTGTHTWTEMNNS